MEKIAESQQGTGGINVFGIDFELLRQPLHQSLGHIGLHLEPDDTGEAPRLELTADLLHQAARLPQVFFLFGGRLNISLSPSSNLEEIDSQGSTPGVHQVQVGGNYLFQGNIAAAGYGYPAGPVVGNLDAQKLFPATLLTGEEYCQVQTQIADEGKGVLRIHRQRGQDGPYRLLAIGAHPLLLLRG